MQSTRMMFAQLAIHSLEKLFLECFAAVTPVLADRLEHFLIGLLGAPSLHAQLKFSPSSRCILWDAVSAEQTVDPNPGWTMLARGSVPAQTAPRIRGKIFVRFQQTRTNRIQMNIIAHGLEIAVAPAIHQR